MRIQEELAQSESNWQILQQGRMTLPSAWLPSLIHYNTIKDQWLRDSTRDNTVLHLIGEENPRLAMICRINVRMIKRIQNNVDSTESRGKGPTIIIRDRYWQPAETRLLSLPRTNNILLSPRGPPFKICCASNHSLCVQWKEFIRRACHALGSGWREAHFEWWWWDIASDGIGGQGRPLSEP